MISFEFNRDFQTSLLTHLVLDQPFFELANGHLQLQDFGLPACRLILEVVRRYYFKYGKLPPFKSLEVEVEQALRDTTGTIETRITPSDFESLGVVLGWIASTRPQDLDTRLYMDKLQEFIMHIRIANLPVQGLSTSEYINAVVGIREAANRVINTDLGFRDASDALPEIRSSTQERIGLGIRSVDTLLAGGLARGEFGLITATTGTGKTNSMIHIGAYSTILRNKHVLYVTLELSDIKIIERYQMMCASVDARYFKLERSRWPEQQLRQYNFFTSLEARANRGSMTVISRNNTKACTLGELDTIIDAWKTRMVKLYGSADDCMTVAVDWLDLIDVSSLPVITKNTSEERRHFHASEGLARLGKKHNVALWTATQGAKKADGKEKLDKTDISWGYSKTHMADVAIGLAKQQLTPEEENAETEGLDLRLFSEDRDLYNDAPSDPLATPPCDRNIIVSIMKAREASTDGMVRKVYQGPTLRFWDKKEQFEQAAQMAAAPDMSGMRALLRMT